ncbi:Helix-turn-helix domain-containing protein [Lachnospira pectinoschiza]|uniref:Helix-turn-helix domain-containing protein n=2 Tax=Lachnospira pectinoschiza TaxID=28052 RepID=A0A1G9T1J1_9FIRM|nr:Helix-turn-helix domain-containing protein [Lachnospira pectinoschiza]
MKNNILKSNIELIKSLYNINFYKIENSEDAMEFSKHNTIHRIQLIFNSDAILTMKNNMSKDYIYLLADIFNISIIVFLIDEELYILGPFTPLLHTREDANQIFRENNIDDLSISDYLRYRNLFPTINEDLAIHIVNSFLKQIEADKATRKVKRPNFSYNNANYDNYESSRDNYVDLLQIRYENENLFMDSIIRGDSASALKYLGKMQKDVSYVKKIGSTLENERIGNAITRTTLRLASQKAGLSAYIIDQISSKNTRRTFSEKNIDKILEYKKEMVIEFCDAIQKLHKNNYSSIINNCLKYLEDHYYEDFYLDLLADEMSISKSYLLKLFKKELGTSPTKYLRKLRIQKACQLLETTTNSIQEISEDIGIVDSNYFVKLFKREKEMTPSQYRKAHNSTTKKLI